MIDDEVQHLEVMLRERNEARAELVRVVDECNEALGKGIANTDYWMKRWEETEAEYTSMKNGLLGIARTLGMLDDPDEDRGEEDLAPQILVRIQRREERLREAERERDEARKLLWEEQRRSMEATRQYDEARALARRLEQAERERDEARKEAKAARKYLNLTCFHLESIEAACRIARQQLGERWPKDDERGEK